MRFKEYSFPSRCTQLSAARKSFGFTYAEIAERAGTTSSAVYQLLEKHHGGQSFLEKVETELGEMAAAKIATIQNTINASKCTSSGLAPSFEIAWERYKAEMAKAAGVAQ